VNRRAIAIGWAAIVTVVMVVFTQQFVVCGMGDPTSDPDLHVCRVDEDRFLVLGRDVALLVNSRERVVVRPSHLGIHLGPVQLWPRDSIRGVQLGDGVKGNPEDRYSFAKDSVSVQYRSSKRVNVFTASLR
jgi:hypothetical protein